MRSSSQLLNYFLGNFRFMSSSSKKKRNNSELKMCARQDEKENFLLHIQFLFFILLNSREKFTVIGRELLRRQSFSEELWIRILSNWWIFKIYKKVNVSKRKACKLNSTNPCTLQLNLGILLSVMPKRDHHWNFKNMPTNKKER